MRDRGLLESALKRTLHVIAYRGADIYLQAATLLWGIVKDHPFVQGNKRTATAIAFFYFERLGYRVEAPQQEVINIVYAIDEGCSVDEVAGWLRKYSRAPA